MSMSLTYSQSTNLPVTSWGYQLQNFDLDELRDSNYDLLVLDYSKDGSDSNRFTLAEIDEIKADGKILLCYLSIGEAEDYRYYFESDWLTASPSWFDQENPNWEGNYKVKYWESEWQQIIFGYIDIIMNQGFDGLYLDIIDGYEFYEASFPDARSDMIDFVLNIANYTRSINLNYLIFPQNGEELLENNEYRQIIDGIGKEDTFILPEDQEKRSEEDLLWITQYLDLLVDDDKLVLTVDYSNDPDLISFAREQADLKGYIEYVGTIDLDELLELDYSGELWRSDIIVTISAVILLLVIILIVYLKFFRSKQD